MREIKIETKDATEFDDENTKLKDGVPIIDTRRIRKTMETLIDTFTEAGGPLEKLRLGGAISDDELHILSVDIFETCAAFRATFEFFARIAVGGLHLPHEVLSKATDIGCTMGEEEAEEKAGVDDDDLHNVIASQKVASIGGDQIRDALDKIAEMIHDPTVLEKAVKLQQASDDLAKEVGRVSFNHDAKKEGVNMPAPDEEA